MWSRHKCHAAGSTPILAGRVEVMGGGGEVTGGEKKWGGSEGGRTGLRQGVLLLLLFSVLFLFVVLRGFAVS